MNNLIGVSGKINSGKDLIGEIIQYLACLKEGYLLDHQNSFKEFQKCPTSNFLQSGYEIKKFADKLKDIVCLLIGCTRRELEDRAFKETPLGDEWKCWSYEDVSNWKISPHDNIPEWPPLLSINKIENMLYGHEREMTPRLLLQLLGTQCGREIIHPNIWINALFADYNPIDNKSLQDPAAENSYPNWIITDVRFPNEAKAIKEKGGILIRVNRGYDNDINKAHTSETALDNYTEFDFVIENNGTIKELIEKIKEII